jgi:hypothetical protein
VTSNFCVERMIASAPDILPQLCRWIGVPLPPDAREGAHLFPRALLAPGWRHLIDNLIRMGLGSLSFSCVVRAPKESGEVPP